MIRQRLAFGISVGVAITALLALQPAASAAPRFQAATPTLPVPRVEVISVDGANVRNGPGTDYDLVGKMIKGQYAPVLGQALNGADQWFKVEYFGGPDNTGWVYVGTTQLIGELSAITTLEIPPTPTRPPTPTLSGLEDLTATPNPDANRLPTFTPPALIVRPTLLPAQGVPTGGGAFPPALAIIILFVLGVFAGGISLLRSRG